MKSILMHHNKYRPAVEFKFKLL